MSDRREYFDKADSWSTDVRAQAARVQRIAWIAAGIATSVAALEAVALAMLVPLKTVEPVTLLVDRQTGFVQALDPANPGRITANDALNRALLAQYVIAREGFDRATISADYRKVALWSAAGARSSYLNQLPAANPESPFNRYSPGSVVAVRVKSVSQLAAGLALVRFDTLVEDQNGNPPEARPWISTVRYRYVGAPMSFEDRLVNPLGFQVLSYKRDAEAVGQPSAADRIPSAFSAGDPSPTQTTVPAPAEAAQAPAVAVFPDGRQVPLSNLPSGSPLRPAVPRRAG